LARAHSRGAKHQAVSTASGPSWFDDEAPLWTMGWPTTRRLIHRAISSWRVWAAAVLVVSGAVAWRRSLAPSKYEAEVVMRVSEGAVASSGSQLSMGSLRAYVNDLAFTTSRLAGVMGKHPSSFPALSVDPTDAIDGFRQRMHLVISQNDFIEDRAPGDPPRSARLVVAFESSDPQLAWSVARELAELVVESALGGQRDVRRREREVAALVAGKADVDLQAILRQGAPPLSARVEGARGRLMEARQRATAAELALRALEEQQAFRVDVIDPGRVPRRHDPVAAALSAFAWAALALSGAALLLAGAFDPRVLDGGDLAPLGLAVLGHLPPLPSRSAPSPREQRAGAPPSGRTGA
jgi:hypothetical protein